VFIESNSNNKIIDWCLLFYCCSPPLTYCVVCSVWHAWVGPVLSPPHPLTYRAVLRMCVCTVWHAWVGPVLSPLTYRVVWWMCVCSVWHAWVGPVLSPPTPSPTVLFYECVFVQFDMLELDRFSRPLVSCPLLLDPASYYPDTVDLTQDAESRDYWLRCFEESTNKFAERAALSQPGKNDAASRSKKFTEKYIRRLRDLKLNPWYVSLSCYLI